jgi:hypothetical protein
MAEIMGTWHVRPQPGLGLTNLAHFIKIRWNSTDLGVPNSKIIEFTVHCFKILEKDKNQQKKYVKKLDRILRLPVKKFL